MLERFELVEKAMVKMLDEKKYAAAKELLQTLNPADAAALFQVVEEEKIPVLFRLLPKELAAEAFVEMET
jgi:magnesium transporter